MALTAVSIEPCPDMIMTWRLGACSRADHQEAVCRSGQVLRSEVLTADIRSIVFADPEPPKEVTP